MLKIDHLQKHYGEFHLRCTMEVEAGRITGLVGPNGAGKSTIFKAILGLIRPESGTVSIFDKDVREFTAEDKRLYGAVLADSGFSGWLCIKEIIPVL